MNPRTETCVGHYLLLLGRMLILDYEKGLMGLCFELQRDDAEAADASRILTEEPFENPKLFLTFQFQLGAVISSARLSLFILFDNFFKKEGVRLSWAQSENVSPFYF